MQIDLSERSVELLHSLTADGSDPRAVVEAAIAFLAHERTHAANLRCVNPATNRELSDDELRGEIQKGIDDIEAGRFVEFANADELHAFFEGVKQSGRDRLAEDKQRAKGEL